MYLSLPPPTPLTPKKPLIFAPPPRRKSQAQMKPYHVLHYVHLRIVAMHYDIMTTDLDYPHVPLHWILQCSLPKIFTG